MELPHKPSEMFDRDDEWNNLARFAIDDTAGATLGVVSGRRRQGKTMLLYALAQATGGLYFAATEATEADSLRRLGQVVADHVGAPAPLQLGSWEHAIDVLLDIGRQRPTVAVLDEFPYLAMASRSLPSVIQHALTPGRPERINSRTRLLLCGSAMSFMGKMLSGTAPLRGRAGLELQVAPLDYRSAAQFWNLDDPRLAVLVHAIVGGTPAYRREYVRDDAASSIAGWSGRCSTQLARFSAKPDTCSPKIQAYVTSRSTTRCSPRLPTATPRAGASPATSDAKRPTCNTRSPCSRMPAYWPAMVIRSGPAGVTTGSSNHS
ncbi:MAG: AAA family ATPase [Pseudonocardiaceae bacterium]